MNMFGKIVLGVLAFFAVFGVVGTFVIIIRDTNKMPPRPDKEVDALFEEMTLPEAFSVALKRNPHKGYKEDLARNEIDENASNNHRVFTRHFPQDATADETLYPMSDLAFQWTATAVLMLSDAGQIDLEAPIGNYLEGLEGATGSVSINSLLTHTSGLDAAGKQATAPNEGSLFSPFNYQLLGQLVEKVTDSSLVDHIRTAIVEELELTCSEYRVNENGEGAWWTCVDDLLIWDMVTSSNRLVRFKTMKKAMIPPKLKNGEYADHGAGWIIKNIRGLRMEQNPGDATTACITRFPEKSFVIVTMANGVGADQDLRELGEKIGRIYLNREFPHPK